MHRKSAGFLAVLLLLTATAAVAKKASVPSRYEPDPEVEPAQGEQLVDGAWIMEGPGLSLLLKQMDTEERAGYLTRNLGLTADPFGVAPGRPERYHVFIFVVENRTDGDVSFNPRSAWMMPSNQQVRSPLGLTQLSFDYRSLGGEMPPAYEKIKSVLYEQSVHVAPGQAVSGLLAYKRVKDSVKGFMIDVRVMTGAGDSVTFQAPYRRIEPEKKKKKKKGSG